MNTYVTIGELIKFYRLQKGLSQTELSQDICSRKYICKIEHNECIPTLDIVNRLSDRLEINLYDTYALMLRHYDIQTHFMIENLNNYFNKRKLHTIPELIAEYSSLPGFQAGEPKLYLKYAEAIYTSNILMDFSKSISIALDGLLENYHSIEDFFHSSSILSNIELSLLLHIAVNSCRQKNFADGKNFFDFLFSYLNKLLSQKHYSVNKNHHFEQNLMCTVLYNQFVFLHETENPQILYERFLHIIDLMRSLHNSFKLPELLLCTAYLEYALDLPDSAYRTYQHAHNLGLYYCPEYLDALEQEILGNYYSDFSN